MAAANASIYVLVNVVEMEQCSEMDEACELDFKLYNTNLVFDRSGCIVSRYRKFNLFVEPYMNVTESAETATFETDFGVTFGHFICFDILFKSPAIDLINMNVTHILYPSMWFSETPFLTSVQIQQSFAQRNNIVLISAGTNSPANSNTGSGIFVGRHGAIEKIISFKNESRMMIAEVPKNVDDLEYEPPAPSVAPYSPLEMTELNLWNFSPPTTFPLTGYFESTVDNVSCEFNVNFTKLDVSDEDVGYGYRLAVFSGVRNYANIVNGGEIHCAIIPCIDENDEETCGHNVKESERLVPSVEFQDIFIKLIVNDDEESYLVMPTTLDTSINPLATRKYVFLHHIEGESQNYSIKSTVDLSNLMTFGIYGRNFNLDNKVFENDEADDSLNVPSENDENNETISLGGDDDDDNDFRLKMIIYVVLMVVLSVVTSIMVYRKLQTPYIKPDLNKRKSCI